jgi:zinc finger MYND domain-containing protein 10
VPPIDLLKITKLEGQIWITYYYLLAKNVYRERYHINSFRKGQVCLDQIIDFPSLISLSQILRLRKYLNEILLDQLPFLVDIQRYLDELTIMDTSSDPGNNGSVFLLQQVSVFREKLIQNKDWEMISTKQIEEVFTMEDKNDPDLRSLAGLYSDDIVEEVMEPQSRGENGQIEEDDYEEITSQLRNR